MSARLSDAREHDPVDHPRHYTAHPSGVECIQITEHMGFNLGNAVKYLWRADLKDDALEDLRKAAWYVEREIHRRTSTIGDAQAAALLEAAEEVYGDERASGSHSHPLSIRNWLRERAEGGS